MKAAADGGGNVPRGVLQEARQKRKPPIKRKGARFDALVARYYPAVYSFACRLTDDPQEAVVLTHHAFISTRKQLRSCDENLFASIVTAAVIRAGVMAA
jgi:DNA-directed RNA polymerase specialized sigma24 family protein